MHEIYFQRVPFPSPFLPSLIIHRANPNYAGRYSVPVLWDKVTATIVCNESAEMLRWLPDAFNDLSPPALARLSLYPEDLREQIDAMSVWLQRDLNAGVYKAGFAASQASYDANVVPVFAALNRCEKILASHRGPFVLGERLTELDVRLYCTVVRFDAVYVQHFKCNLCMVRDGYPHLRAWVGNLYFNVKGFRESTDFRHVKENYTKSHGE